MGKAEPKKRVGRPPKGDAAMTQSAIRLPQSMVDELDEIVAERFGQADRAAVTREMIALGLAVRKKGKWP